MEAGDGGRVNRDVGLLTASDQDSSPLQRVAVGSNHEYSCLAAGLFQRLCCHNDENLQKKDFQKQVWVRTGVAQHFWFGRFWYGLVKFDLVWLNLVWLSLVWLN